MKVCKQVFVSEMIGFEVEVFSTSYSLEMYYELYRTVFVIGSVYENGNVLCFIVLRNVLRIILYCICNWKCIRKWKYTGIVMYCDL